ncbi:MAG: HD domain-containing protein, partial [Planctomycetes bacterium]|nr:HD domain-containing protein [Planctomycetota bacterium]
METKGHEAEKPLAWLAVGGYGRGLLNPFSDVDVMVLHPGEISPYLEDMVSTAFHLFWDTGLPVSHSCRSIAETQKVMREDSWIATSVLESRCLAGDQALYEQFRKEVVADFLAKNRYQFVEQKIVEAEKRHKSEGGSVYLTEPNVKENAGGLRDMNMVFWTGTALAGDPAAMRVPGLVQPDERQMARAMKAYELQLRIRTEMHLRAGRRSDVLDRGTQADIAAAFGYKDSDGASALSAFMRDYLLAAREVNGLLRTLVSRFRYLRRIQHGMAARVGRRVLERDFVAVGDRIFLGRNDLFDGPGGRRNMMRIFLCSQRHRLEVSEEALQHIRHQIHRVDDAFRQDPEVAAMFMEILRGASGVADTLQAMAESGLLGEYLPEFGELDCLVHYEAYHDYTVDEHTLMSIRTIDELSSADSELDRPKREILAQVTRPCLLKLALLLHDIGKPRGSEHTERGATMIPLIARQLSLPEPDGKLVMFLVENHLAMADLSQRRDFNEEGVL